MKIVNSSAEAINLAVRVLQRGKSIVYPTDTAYALGADATNVAAVKKLFQIKGRSFKKPVHVVVANLEMAKRYAKFDKLAKRLFKKFLPGALTLVLNLSSSLSPRQGRGVRTLSAGTGTIGIRMPHNETALKLVKKLRKPITATSANLADGKTPYGIKDCLTQFRNKKYRPDLILDAGQLPKRKPSTLVKVSNGQIKILRQGPVSKKQIENSLK